MRRLVGRIGIIPGALALIALGAPMSPAHAAAASPSSVTVDCGSTANTTETITGAVGDLLTIANSSATDMCDVYSASSILDLGFMSAIGPSMSETYAILAAGTFEIPGPMGSGTAATITVVIGGSDGGGGESGGDSGHIDGVGEPRPQDVPNPSGGVSAVGGLYSATVSWKMPTQSGPQPVSLYEVTASPDGQQCTAIAPSTSCTVTGLHPGTTYTFTVKANSAIGWGPASAESNPVVPTGVVPGMPRYLSADRLASSVIAVDWAAPDNATGRPFGYEVQQASCPLPCRSVEGLPYTSDLVDYYAGERDARVYVNNRTNPIIIRVRTVAFDGQASGWAYTSALNPRELTEPRVLEAYSDAGGSQVSWTDDDRNALWVEGYEVLVSTKATADAAASPWRVVGTTAEKAIRVGPQDASTPFVRYAVRTIPSAMRRLVTPIPVGLASAPSEWRRQTNLVPTPKIVDATFGPRAGRVSVQWEPREGEGAINVVRFYIQYLNATTGEWTDGLLVAGREARSAEFSLTREQAANVNGVRVRAVSWPGQRFSNWALARN